LTDQKKRADRNKTISLTDTEKASFKSHLVHLDNPVTINEIINKTICQDIFDILDYLPPQSVDLLFADPPYNLSKSFNGRTFSELPLNQYEEWLDSWIPKLPRILKPTASLYICGDWRSSSAIHRVIEKYFVVRNRITWEREKGRGAKTNWKNSSEDIWFCTASQKYTFNVDAVKLNA
jgi:site-specific DNA-methyltransferase (adenine-specific)